MSLVDGGKPLPLISFEAIITEPRPPVDWEVEPLIATGDRVVLYGEFGSMKSWLLLNLGLYLAAGTPWLGKFPISKPKHVLYLDEEMNERTLRRRIKRLAEGAGLHEQALEFRAMSRAGVTFDALGAQMLLAALKTSQFDPEVIIVESLRRVLVGSENEAKDVGAFWRNVQPILTAGKTMIISHHMRKPNALGNNAPRDRASGSTDILAGADAGFSVQRLSKDAVVIECVKLREAEETEPFVVSLSEQEVGGPVEMCFEGSKKEFDDFGTKVEKAMSLAKTFLAALPARTAKTGDIIAHLKAHGVAEKTSERALAQLRKLGGVQKVGHGVWQSVSQQQAA